MSFVAQNSRWLAALLLTVAACGGSTEQMGSDPSDGADEPVDVAAPCDAPPAGFVAWQSGGLVSVSKRTPAFVGGAQTYAVVQHVDASELPAVIDFGTDLIEVRPGPTLCIAE